MTYKSIATILHEPTQDKAAFECAIAFARKAGAHLHVLCVGVDDTDPGFYYAGAQALVVQQSFEFSQGVANKLEASARERLANEDIAWDVQNVTTLPGGLDIFVSDTMRFFDLIVLPTPYQEASDRADTLIFEASVLGANRPVLMVPPAWSRRPGRPRSPALTHRCIATKGLIGVDDWRRILRGSVRGPISLFLQGHSHRSAIKS